eukprot:9190439-Lingulodinium_polyedra.AAC.1
MSAGHVGGTGGVEKEDVHTHRHVGHDTPPNVDRAYLNLHTCWAQEVDFFVVILKVPFGRRDTGAYRFPLSFGIANKQSAP